MADPDFPKVGNEADQNSPKHTRKLYFVLALYMDNMTPERGVPFYDAVPFRLLPLNYTFVWFLYSNLFKYSGPHPVFLPPMLTDVAFRISRCASPFIMYNLNNYYIQNKDII